MGLYKDKAYNVEEQNIIKERIPNDRLLITKDCEICQNIDLYQGKAIYQLINILVLTTVSQLKS